ncbi:MAG: prepilin peptidase [bacterium]|nr:prepilin peptidase [bacterium]
MLILIWLFIIGLFIGSFLNVLADRLPRGETILGRSKCESCKHVLAWNDLIPVISYLSLHGKCRYCKKIFSSEYMWAEIGTGVMFSLTWYLSELNHFQLSQSVISLGLISALIVMFLADMRYKIIPDSMQVAFGLLAVLMHSLSFIRGDIETSIYVQRFGKMLLDGIIVMGPLLLIFLITRGKGMGFGDVKYSFVLGLLLGMWNGFIALYMSFVLGGIIGVYLLFVKKMDRKKSIPFGPYLFIGTYIMYFFETDILLFIQRIYGF